MVAASLSGLSMVDFFSYVTHQFVLTRGAVKQSWPCVKCTATSAQASYRVLRATPCQQPSARSGLDTICRCIAATFHLGAPGASGALQRFGYSLAFKTGSATAQGLKLAQNHCSAHIRVQ